MPYLDGVPQINGNVYGLMSELDARERFSRRNWSSKWLPVATKIEPRPDVIMESPDAGLIVLDDWSKGVCGEVENRPYTLYIASRCSGVKPGALKPLSGVAGATATAVGGEQDSCAVVRFGNDIMFVMGRYVYYSPGGGTIAQDEDFGSGVAATCAVIHNNAMVVGFGAATNKIQSRATNGTYTAATDNTYADLLAKVEDNLVRITATSQASQCGPSDNPLTLSVWSAGIPVGDAAIGCTALLAYGEQYAVCKPTGMHLGDAGAVFPNVFPDLEANPDPENGLGAVSEGAYIYYPHTNGLLRYKPGEGAVEIGIDRQWQSAEQADTLPGTRIRALTVHGADIWAVTDPSGFPQADPTGFQKTTDNGVGYTSYLTGVTDDDSADFTTNPANLNSLDTVGNGDWLVVGYSSQFYGVRLEMALPNSNTSTLTAAFWNGSGWTTITEALYGFFDGTSRRSMATPLVRGTATLSQSGIIHWGPRNLSTDWVTSTINSINAYWIRLSVSAALSNPCSIGEARVLTTESASWLWHGRPRQVGDTFDAPVIWEAIGPASTTFHQGVSSADTGPRGHTRITALGVNRIFPSLGSDTLIGLSSTRITQQQIGDLVRGPDDLPVAGGGATYYAITCKHDAGLPNVNKQFLGITVKGRYIDSVRDVAIDYRVDNATAWTSASSSVTSSPTTISLSAVTGYTIQLRITFNAFVSDYRMTEINEIEIRFRPLNTMVERQELMLAIPAGEGANPPPDVAVANLETALRGAAALYKDPARRTMTTASMTELEILEWYEAEGGFPAIAARVVMQEV